MYKTDPEIDRGFLKFLAWFLFLFSIVITPISGNSTSENLKGRDKFNVIIEKTKSSKLDFSLLDDKAYSGWIIPEGKDSGNHFDFSWCNINGDDFLDAVSWHHNRDFPTVAINDRDGTFTLLDPKSIGLGRGQNGSLRMSCKDVNGDGKDDLFVRDQDLGDGIYYSVGKGSDIRFRYSNGLPTGAGGDYLILDWNGDDKFDYADEGKHEEYSIYSLQRGKRISTCFDHTDSPKSRKDHKSEGYVVIDWNLDTYPDIIHPASGTIMINHEGKSCSRLDLSYETTNKCIDSVRGQGERGHTVVDMDNDGDWDFTCSEVHTNNGNKPKSATYSGWHTETDNWQVYRQTSVNKMTLSTPSSLVSMRTLTNAQPPSNFIWADYKNDGFVDLHLQAYEKGRAVIWNNNNGKLSDKFVEHTALQGSTQNKRCQNDGRIKAQAGDFDNDGRLDVVRNWSDCSGKRHGAMDIARNVGSDLQNWIRLHLSCEGNNSDCLFSVVNVYEAGTTNRVAPMLFINSGFDENFKDPHIGVGSAVNLKVEIILPYNRGTYIYDNIPVNRAIKVDFTTSKSPWDSYNFINPYKYT